MMCIFANGNALIQTVDAIWMVFLLFTMFLRSFFIPCHRNIHAVGRLTFASFVENAILCMRIMNEAHTRQKFEKNETNIWNNGNGTVSGLKRQQRNGKIYTKIR